MPQLDLFTFFHQFLFVFISLCVLYVTILKFDVPSLSALDRFRADEDKLGSSTQFGWSVSKSGFLSDGNQKSGISCFKGEEGVNFSGLSLHRDVVQGEKTVQFKVMNAGCKEEAKVGTYNVVESGLKGLGGAVLLKPSISSFIGSK
uniref:ATP synthase F0 subunit 8 n=1 Tax=Chloropicon sp. RCC4434 TaxID=2565277 RepID=A0A4D6C7K1_9CHLO|nr:ATP synthase F0 subunit 8 [Chloropicon sp. RCC4434]